MSPDILSAFALGLAGFGHCLGMCGGIAVALNLGSQAGITGTLAYHSGRLLSYTALGAAVGAAAGAVDYTAWTLFLRYLAGALLIAMGLYVGDWWRGLAWLERGGAYVWRPVRALAKPLLPVRHPVQALALGLCWGLMPCGLIYSGLAWAMTAADPFKSALLMLSFGAGTLPAMLATSLGADRVQAFLRRRELKLAIAVLLIASGLWTLWQTHAHSAHLIQPPTAEEGGGHHHDH